MYSVRFYNSRNHSECDTVVPTFHSPSICLVHRYVHSFSIYFVTQLSSSSSPSLTSSFATTKTVFIFTTRSLFHYCMRSSLSLCNKNFWPCIEFGRMVVSTNRQPLCKFRSGNISEFIRMRVIVLLNVFHTNADLCKMVKSLPLTSSYSLSNARTNTPKHNARLGTTKTNYASDIPRFRDIQDSAHKKRKTKEKRGTCLACVCRISYNNRNVI